MNENNFGSNKTLKDIPMFSELSIAQLRELTSITKIQKFKKNEFLFMEGDTYMGFFILLKGSVKVYKISSDGKEVIIHLIKPPQAFAEIPLFEGKNYPVNAQALEESIVLFFPKGEFIELLKQNHEISFNMLGGFAKRMRTLTLKIEELSSKEVTTRLARYLVEEIRNAGKERLPEPFIKLSISKSAIAGFLGTITETLSRTLKKLQDEKIIRVKGKTIFISDYKRLKELGK